MKYTIRHTTTYGYSEPAALSQNEVCLFPRQTATQQCHEADLRIDPEPSVLDSRIDFFGNRVHAFMVKQPHRKLTVLAQSRVVTSDPVLPDPSSTPPWESVRTVLMERDGSPVLEALPFVFPSPFVRPARRFADYALGAFTPQRPILEAALDLTGRIYREFAYEKNATAIGTPLDTVMDNKKGVCQDFAHLAIACLRSLGLAARYVSGYLETLPPPGKPKLVGADASHAWLSVWLPGSGWIDLDPTNDMIPAERHIRVAWGRDYGDVTPVKGVIWGGGTHTLKVSVDVAKEPAP